MNYKKNMITMYSLIVVVIVIGLSACQKMSRPPLGDYPKDTNPPGGPLKFYAAFDGTSSSPLMNAVDSIRANFPSDNPMTAVTGISGKGIEGDGTKFISYAGVNDFPSLASSFTVAFWEKRDGIPNGNASFVFTIPSGNGQWGSYGFSMFLLFDWGNWTPATSAKIKFYMVDDSCKCDNWFTWDGTGGTTLVPNVQDNNWHHIAFVYDATTSGLTLYVDGVANPYVLNWGGGHGAEHMDGTKVQGLNIGGNTNISNMGWGQDWDGDLDQFRFYATALSAADVQALYNGKQ